MHSLIKSLGLLPLLVAGACSVTDENNGSTTVELDQNRIEAGTAALANEAGEAAETAGDAIRNAGPAIEQSADDIQERAGRVANRIDNVDVDVDLNTSDGDRTTNAN